MVTVQKRFGGDEPFDPEKLADSIHSACRRVHGTGHGCAELADTVVKAVTSWAEDRATVRSSRIRRRVITVLEDEDQGVAYAYKRYTYDHVE